MSEYGNTTGRRLTIAVGILTIALGTIPVLAMSGILPHGSPGPDPAPSWMGWLSGLVFISAGILVVMKGLVRGPDNANGDLPVNAPRIARAVYDMLAVVIVCSLAMMFTWIAFGPGSRHFSVSAGGMSMTISGAGDTVGRIAFGFGSVLFWCAAVAFVVTMVRRWRR